MSPDRIVRFHMFHGFKICEAAALATPEQKERKLRNIIVSYQRKGLASGAAVGKPIFEWTCTKPGKDCTGCELANLVKK